MSVLISQDKGTRWWWWDDNGDGDEDGGSGGGSDYDGDDDGSRAKKNKWQFPFSTTFLGVLMEKAQ